MPEEVDVDLLVVVVLGFVAVLGELVLVVVFDGVMRFFDARFFSGAGAAGEVVTVGVGVVAVETADARGRDALPPQAPAASGTTTAIKTAAPRRAGRTVVLLTLGIDVRVTWTGIDHRLVSAGFCRAIDAVKIARHRAPLEHRRSRTGSYRPHTTVIRRSRTLLRR